MKIRKIRIMAVSLLISSIMMTGCGDVSEEEDFKGKVLVTMASSEVNDDLAEFKGKRLVEHYHEPVLGHGDFKGKRLDYTFE